MQKGHPWKAEWGVLPQAWSKASSSRDCQAAEGVLGSELNPRRIPLPPVNEMDGAGERQ